MSGPVSESPGACKKSPGQRYVPLALGCPLPTAFSATPSPGHTATKISVSSEPLGVSRSPPGSWDWGRRLCPSGGWPSPLTGAHDSEQKPVQTRGDDNHSPCWPPQEHMLPASMEGPGSGHSAVLCQWSPGRAGLQKWAAPCGARRAPLPPGTGTLMCCPQRGSPGTGGTMRSWPGRSLSHPPSPVTIWPFQIMNIRARVEMLAKL